MIAMWHRKSHAPRAGKSGGSEHGRKRRRFSPGIIVRCAGALCALAAVAALMVAPAPASAINITWTDDSPYYFWLYGGGYGQYRFRDADTGAIVYCITPDVDAPLGNCPISYEASVKLTNLLLHGYPARASYGSLSADQWENCTQLAIWCAYGGKPRQDFECDNPEMFEAVDYLIAQYDKPLGSFLSASEPQGADALPQAFDTENGIWRCGPYKFECDLGYGGVEACLRSAPSGSYIGDASGNAISAPASGDEFYIYLKSSSDSPKVCSIESKDDADDALLAQVEITATGVQPSYLCWRSETSGLQDLVSTTTLPIVESHTFASEWGYLEFDKTSEDGIGLSQRFRLSGPSGEQIFSTDELGHWESGPLLPGTYTATELDVPKRYTEQPAMKIDVAGGTPTATSFKNTLKRGSIKIEKASWKDADATVFHFAVSGANTGFYKEVEASVGSPAVIDGLLCDTYTIAEIDVDEHEYILPAPIEVQVTEDNCDVEQVAAFENGEALPRLIIEKSAQDTADVSGTMFKIEGKKGWSKTVSIPKGENSVTVELPARDTYTVTEINAPARYAAQEPQVLEAVDGNTYKVSFENTLKPETPTPVQTPTPTPKTPTQSILPKTSDNLVLWMGIALASVAFTYCCAIYCIFNRGSAKRRKTAGKHSDKAALGVSKRPRADR